jgi:hypothetical protein
LSTELLNFQGTVIRVFSIGDYISEDHLAAATGSPRGTSHSSSTLPYHQEAVIPIESHSESNANRNRVKGTGVTVAADGNVNNWRRGKYLYQFRRGSYPAVVYCLSFAQDSAFLCVSSDTGTIHLFKLENTPTNNNNNSTKDYRSAEDRY